MSATAAPRGLAALPTRHRWGLGDTADGVLALGVLALGLAVSWRTGVGGAGALAALCVVAAAVAARRRAPVLAAALAAVSGVVQVAALEPVSGVQVGMLVVVYSAPAHGSRALVWASGLALPAVAVVATVHQLGTGSLLPVVPGATTAPPWVQLVVLGALSLVVPLLAWLLGLLRRAVLRSREERWLARAASAEASRAEHAAVLERERAELAREVHDVVGHSLAVVIAQADSVRFRDPSDPASTQHVHEAVAAIAATARRSLGEVREVLARLGPPSQDAAPAAVTVHDLLVEVERAGVVLQRVHEGEPRDLPEAPRAVLAAVVREMLTNALRHGDRRRAVVVTQRWSDDALVVQVRNTASSDAAAPGRGGHGVPGMRARLERIGGRLTTTVQASACGPGDDFTATARVPVPAAPQRPVAP